MKSIYKFFKSSWGIYIEIEYDISLRNSTCVDMTNISLLSKVKNRIFLEFKDKIDYTFYFYIDKGVSDLSNLFETKINSDESLFITISRITFNWSDFQKEALYCAIQEALAKYFDLQVPIVDIEYNKSEDKYIFTLPNGKILN